MKRLLKSADLKEIIIEKELVYDKITMVDVSIKYPKIINGAGYAAVKRINAYYRRVVDLFLQNCEQKLLKLAVEDYKYAMENNFPFRQYSAALAYEATYNKNCTLSLYYDRYEYTGGAHGLTLRSSETWCLMNGFPLPLKEFFPRGVKFKKALISYSIAQAERQMREGTGMYFEKYRKLIAKNFDPESFYLTEQGLAVYYQQYAIAPYAQGIPVFTMPYGPDGPEEPSC